MQSARIYWLGGCVDPVAFTINRECCVTDIATCYQAEYSSMPLTDPSIYCPLCQCDLHAAQTWHYLLEEGTEEDGSRTGQPVHRHFMEMIRLTEEERSQETTVHDYCWWIVMRIFRKVNFDQAWIDQFKSYIHLLSPFMQEAPFCDESDTLDLDVFMTFKTASRKEKTQRPLYIPLPPEAIQRIYRFLDREEDIINLDDTLSVGPCPKQWRELGFKYMLADDLDPRENIKTLIRNLQEQPKSRFPKTTNYRIIWANVEILWTVMDTLLVITNVPADALVAHGIKVDDYHNSVRYAIGLRGAHYIIFMFSETQDIQVLCGIAINGRTIGHEGPIWRFVQVTSLTGLRIAYVENHFVGIQIKDNLSWQDKWHGERPEYSACTTFEWDSRSSEIVASHDVGSSAKLYREVILLTTTRVIKSQNSDIGFLLGRHTQPEWLVSEPGCWSRLPESTQSIAHNLYI